MDIIEAIKERRSVRRFKPDPVPGDLIRNIIEMATWAPSACNIQGWRFIVIDDQKIKEKIVDQGGAATIKAAPVGILVVYDHRTRNLEYQDYLQSAAAAIQNLLLAAHNFGLASSWICQLPLKQRLRKILKIPGSFSPMAYVLLGYPERESFEVPRKHPLDSLIGYNVFNTQAPPEEINSLKRFFSLILIKIYYHLPAFFKKRFLNKFIDRNFVKKFKN